MFCWVEILFGTVVGTLLAPLFNMSYEVFLSLLNKFKHAKIARHQTTIVYGVETQQKVNRTFTHNFPYGICRKCNVSSKGEGLSLSYKFDCQCDNLYVEK